MTELADKTDWLLEIGFYHAYDDGEYSDYHRCFDVTLVAHYRQCVTYRYETNAFYGLLIGRSDDGSLEFENDEVNGSLEYIVAELNRQQALHSPT